MKREADKTIKGFLYQFIKTFKQMLEEEETTLIKVEGIIEDIDVIKDDETIAIQCKYHESMEDFNLSAIYKPILQFLVNFSKNPDKKIKYILFAHFPNEDVGKKEITKENVEDIISTDNMEYITKYISKLKPASDPEILEILSKIRTTKEEKLKVREYYKTNELEINIEIERFLEKHFEFLIGESFTDLETLTKDLLISESFSKADVDEIFFPNAIQKISEISTLQNHNDRTICKKDFISELVEVKKTAITRWTKELNNYKQIMKKRKQQLSTNLSMNIRKRYFLIDKKDICDFNENIITFLQSYVDTYVSKPKLHKELPIFLFNDSPEVINDIVERLHIKGIESETGIRGSKFYSETFMKDPKRVINDGWIQFKLRIGSCSNEMALLLNENKCDDLFNINNTLMESLDNRDICNENLEIENLKELSYLLNLKKEL